MRMRMMYDHDCKATHLEPGIRSTTASDTFFKSDGCVPPLRAPFDRRVSLRRAIILRQRYRAEKPVTSER
eukprot:1195039-Prorocentrum_minimum.AAC.6